MNLFLISILGGASIAVGGTVFINAPNAVIGSFLFSLGLFLVCHFKWGLYTGRVQNLIETAPPPALKAEKAGGENGNSVKGLPLKGGTIKASVKSALPELIIVYIGNLVGTFAVGTLVAVSGKADVVSKVATIAEYKLSLPLLNVLILSFFCGIMMYVAVTGFKRIEDPVGKHLAIVLPVMVFILSGFEHSIADLFYITAGNAWGIAAVKFSAVAAVGNLLGGCLIPAFAVATNRR